MSTEYSSMITDGDINPSQVLEKDGLEEEAFKVL